MTDPVAVSVALALSDMATDHGALGESATSVLLRLILDQLTGRPEALKALREAQSRSGDETKIRLLATEVERLATGPQADAELRRLWRKVGTSGPDDSGFRNEFSGTAQAPVVQAHDIAGDVHLHLPSDKVLPLPRQLPADVQNFTGRAAALADLSALLPEASEGTPMAAVISIEGTAGVGKTALAVHWAHHVRDRFPDGDLYVNLQGHDPTGAPLAAAEVLDDFLRSLGAPISQIPQHISARSTMFRSLLSTRRVLILLDNAARAEQVRPLLPGASTCPVVVTSRNRLHGLVIREGAHRVTLNMLSLDEAVSLLSRIVGARRSKEDPEAIIELTELCARLPLALRIAGERIAAHPHNSLADFVSELRDDDTCLDALDPGDDETSAIRAVFSWSYRALPPDQARMFRLLGLHPGPEFSVYAAAALINAPVANARRLLDALQSAHLLEQYAASRYRFHDLLRSYAAQCAASSASQETDTATRSVLSWYLHTGANAARPLRPANRIWDYAAPPTGCEPLTFATYEQGLNWCESERANLVAATHYALTSGHPDIAWQIPTAVRSFFDLRKYWIDWSTTLDAALTATRRLGDMVAEGQVLSDIGHANTSLRRFERAIPSLEQSLTVRREAGDRFGEGGTLSRLGQAYATFGRHEDAARCLEQALVVRREVADAYGEGITLTNLGDVLRVLHRTDEAIDRHHQAIEVNRRTGNQYHEGIALHNLGNAYRDAQNFDEALAKYQEAIAIHRRIGNRWGEALTLSDCARLLQKIGEIDAARDAFQRTLTILEDLGAPEASEIRAHLAAILRDHG